MKTVDILKGLIIFYYYLIGIAFFGCLLIPLVWLSNINFSLNILGNKPQLSSLDLSQILYVTVLLSVMFFFYFKAIRFIKKSLNNLSEGNYFSQLVIDSFKKAGIYLLICAMLEPIIKIILSLVLNYKLKLIIDLSIILFLIIGLFLLFLSQVFSKGKKLETENDLTI